MSTHTIDLSQCKVVKVTQDDITFDNGSSLQSYHEDDCCETHFLTFQDLTLADFDGLVFDLTKDSFFERVEGYGIRLIPIEGHPVSVPGYGSNNGYYSSDLDLQVIHPEGGVIKSYNISECQEWEPD